MARELTPGNTYVVPTAELRPHPLAGVVPQLGQDQYGRLKRSIKRLGVRHPLVVTASCCVIDGHHRLRIAQELDIKTLEVRCEPDPHSAEWEMIDCALQQRNIPETQRVALALKQKEIEAAYKKARGEPPAQDQGNATGCVGTIADTKRAEQRDVAQRTGASERLVREVQEVKAKAPDLAPAMERGELSANEGKKVIVERERAAAAPVAASVEDATDGNYNAFECRLRASGGIPEALAEYAAMPEHADAADQLEKLKRAAGFLKRPYEALGFTNTHLLDLKRAVYNLEAAMPWDACICMRGVSVEMPCGWCKGVGWLNKEKLALAWGAAKHQGAT